MTARPHTILKTLKWESNNQLCLALHNFTEIKFLQNNSMIRSKPDPYIMQRAGAARLLTFLIPII